MNDSEIVIIKEEVDWKKKLKKSLFDWLRFFKEFSCRKKKKKKICDDTLKK